MVWKIIVLSKWVIYRFHVNLPGCKAGFLFCGSNLVLLYLSVNGLQQCKSEAEVSKLSGGETEAGFCGWMGWLKNGMLALLFFP